MIVVSKMGEFVSNVARLLDEVQLKKFNQVDLLPIP